MVRMFNVYFPSRILLLVTSEAILIALSVLVAAFFPAGRDLELVLVYESGIAKALIATFVLMLCMYYFDLYDSPILRKRWEVLGRIVEVLGTASVLLGGLYYAFPAIQLSRRPFLTWIILAGVILAGWRQLFFTINKTSGLSERTLLLGAGPMAAALSTEIGGRPELGLNLVGYVEGQGSPAADLASLKYLGEIEQLPFLVEREHAKRVILTMDDRRGRLPVAMLLELKGRGIVIQEAADVYEAVTGKLSLSALRASWLLFSDGFRVSPFTLVYKRVASVFISLAGLVVTAPIMLLVALAIRLDSPGPVIFRQRRVGKGGEMFTIYKFRSMRVDADLDGTPRPAMENDDRVTGAGRWLRRLRLDELPQLVNILLGDMYFRGPRPFVSQEEAALAEMTPFYTQRRLVKPGATGWAQVRRGYCATLEDNLEKLSYDLFYIKNISIGLDCLILFHTLKILLLGRGGR